MAMLTDVADNFVLVPFVYAPPGGYGGAVVGILCNSEIFYWFP